MPRIASKIGATEQILFFKSSPYGKQVKYFMLMPIYYNYFSYLCYACA